MRIQPLLSQTLEHCLKCKLMPRFTLISISHRVTCDPPASCFARSWAFPLYFHGDVHLSHPALQSLVREPLSRRRQLLRENFVETEGEFVFATSLDTKDMEQIAEFLEQSVKGEGVPRGLCPSTLSLPAP